MSNMFFYGEGHYKQTDFTTNDKHAENGIVINLRFDGVAIGLDLAEAVRLSKELSDTVSLASRPLNLIPIKKGA